MKLEKVLKYKKGKSPQKGQNDENLILYLTPEYLRGNSTPNYIPDFSTKAEVLDGDLLLLWDGSNAGEFFKGKKGILSSTMVKFDFDKLEYNSDFLFYQLKAFEGYLKAQTNGSGIPHVDKEILLGLEIENFKKPEQTRIAEILSTADETITHTEALIAKYQRIKTGLMQDLLTKGIDENGNIRSEATHQFKDSPLGRIPKEWDCDKLISFCQKIQDGTHFSPKTDANGTYKYITSKNIRMGYLDLSNLEFLDEVSHNKIYKRCSVELGDVLLTKDGASTGNICINDLNEEFSLLSSVALIRGKQGVLKNEYIFQFFMEKKGQRALIEQMAGNAITRITLSKINNTLIKVPPFHEQELIIQRLKPLDELVNDEKTKLFKLQSLKTGLMQDLLSGKVRVKVKEEAQS